MSFFTECDEPPLFRTFFDTAGKVASSSQDLRRDFIYHIAEKLGCSEQEQIEFLRERTISPEMNSIHQIPGALAAEGRLRNALDSGERILLFGDFDCDGVCSVVILMEFLRTFCAEKDKIRFFIPNRTVHGYGLTEAAIASAFRSDPVKPTLVIAVDCGTNSETLVRKIKDEYGADTIVIDHHQVQPSHRSTSAIALLNPAADSRMRAHERAMCELCAAGLTFLFCSWLAERWGVSEWPQGRCLFLAGLATVADVVPMLRINRVLVSAAIRIANDAPGDVPAALFEVRKKFARGRRKLGAIDEITFGMEWAPCINAFGRIDDAAPAVEMLTETDGAKSSSRGQEAFEINKERQGLDTTAFNEAKYDALAQVDDPEEAPIILAARPHWHLGVVGIVAGRLRETFCRPAVVCGIDTEASKDGKIVWRGSGRSVPESSWCPGFDMGRAFADAQAEGLVLKAGGHYMAGGVTFTEEQRPRFHQWLIERCQLKKSHFTRICEIPTYAGSFTAKAWRELFRGLVPFGARNERFPIIARNAKLYWAHIIRIRVLGESDFDISPEEEVKKAGLTLLYPQDITRASIICKRLRDGARPIDRFLWDTWPSELRQRAMKVRKKDDEDALLKEEICKAFNKIIRGDFLLKHGFKAVQKQTEEWIERIEAREGCPTRTESMRINRFLLEDAFLQEIARSGEFKPWLVVARFRASDGPNTEIYAQWRDTNRACRELRVNELYTLSLIPNSSTYPHAPDYIIENCWRRPALLANSMTTGCRDNCGSV